MSNLAKNNDKPITWVDTLLSIKWLATVVLTIIIIAVAASVKNVWHTNGVLVVIIMFAILIMHSWYFTTKTSCSTIKKVLWPPTTAIIWIFLISGVISTFNSESYIWCIFWAFIITPFTAYMIISAAASAPQKRN